MMANPFDGVEEQLLREAKEALGQPEESFWDVVMGFVHAVDWQVRGEGASRHGPWPRAAQGGTSSQGTSSWGGPVNGPESLVHACSTGVATCTGAKWWASAPAGDQGGLDAAADTGAAICLLATQASLLLTPGRWWQVVGRWWQVVGRWQCVCDQYGTAAGHGRKPYYISLCRVLGIHDE